MSQQWLLAYIKQLYGNLPDDLNADLALHEIETYLADRMDDEIGKLGVIKKIRLHYSNTFKSQIMRRLEDICGAARADICRR